MQPPKKIGAPPKREPRPGERFQLGVRVTPRAKRTLEDFAAATGRSISQEAELRLEQSFERNALVPEVLTAIYGKELAGLITMLGLVMLNAGLQEHWSRSDFLEGDIDNWTDDPTAYDQAVKGAIKILEAFRPEGAVCESAANPSVQVAQAMIRAVRNRKSGHWGWHDPFTKPMPEMIRDLIGPKGDNLKEPRS